MNERRTERKKIDGALRVRTDANCDGQKRRSTKISKSTPPRQPYVTLLAATLFLFICNIAIPDQKATVFDYVVAFLSVKKAYAEVKQSVSVGEDDSYIILNEVRTDIKTGTVNNDLTQTRKNLDFTSGSHGGNGGGKSLANTRMKARFKDDSKHHVVHREHAQSAEKSKDIGRKAATNRAVHPTHNELLANAVLPFPLHEAHNAKQRFRGDKHITHGNNTMRYSARGDVSTKKKIVIRGGTQKYEGTKVGGSGGSKIGRYDGYDVGSYTFTDSDGVKYQIENFRGKWIILYFWASWSMDSVDGLISLDKLATHLRRAKITDMVVLPVSLDFREHSYVKNLYAKNGLGQFFALFDDMKTATALFRLNMPPTAFIIDNDGVIRERIDGQFMWDRDDVYGALTAMKAGQEISGIGVSKGRGFDEDVLVDGTHFDADEDEAVMVIK